MSIFLASPPRNFPVISESHLGQILEAMVKVAAALVLAAASSVSAFAPSTTSRASTALNAEMSQSLPFLLAPKNTKGWLGDVGFDPFGFSDYFDMKWLRESEIKHGRISMLAALGFWQQQYITLPGLTHVDDSNLAPQVVGASAMLQIVFWIGVLEFWTNKGNVTMLNMFEDPDRVPGEFGFDPLGLSVGKSEDELNRMKLQELKNGRLAMLAIGGMIHHNWVTGEPLL